MSEFKDNCAAEHLEPHNGEYVGRIAPTPSGHLHGIATYDTYDNFEQQVKCLVGHAQTFLIAKMRASRQQGKLILRSEDLDGPRCKTKYYDELLEDLKWFGLNWDWGDDVISAFTRKLNPRISSLPFLSDRFNIGNDVLSSGSGTDTDAGTPISIPNDPPFPDVSLLDINLHNFKQSNRKPLYLTAFRYLLHVGIIYPSSHSRRDVDAAVNVSAPHEGDHEVIFPPSLRPSYVNAKPGSNSYFPEDVKCILDPQTLGVNWRFRVPDGERIEFVDGRYGHQRYVCGEDFGDFVIWRGCDNIPSYEFAVVVDDVCMGITEVVRGEDLLRSTARQILIYRALGVPEVMIPQFYHCPLIRNAEGVRLAKRAYSQTIRSLQESGYTPGRIAKEFFASDIYEEYCIGTELYLSK